MSEENKEELDSQKPDEQPAEEPLEEEGQEPEDPKESDDSAQLDVRLQKEKEAIEEARKKLAQEAYDFREEKRKLKDEEEPDGQLTEERLRAILAEEKEATRREFQEREINSEVGKLSDNPKEIEAIVATYRNRRFPEYLTLQEKLRECYAIVNQDKLIGENSELKRALKNKNYVSRDASGTIHDGLSASAPKMAAADKTVIEKEAGFKWNATKKRFEKTLPSGKVLVKGNDRNFIAED